MPVEESTFPPSPSADLCVFIGRFQPFHAGHAQVVEEGLRQGRRLLVLVGSANEPRTLRNPFTADERIGMIQRAFGGHPRLCLRALEDSTGDLADWLTRARATADRVWRELAAADPAPPAKPRVALIGHAKDATSYYLKLFPQWASIDVPLLHPLSATHARDALLGSFGELRPTLEQALARYARQEFTGDPIQAVSAAESRVLQEFRSLCLESIGFRARWFLATQRARGCPDLPAATVDFLEAFMDSPAYGELLEESVAAARVRWQWRRAPYPAKHVTADAAVFHDGCVLMVKRQGFPGRGLWALPGGFVEDDEPVLDAALRELVEETGLEVPARDLLACRSGQAVFDAPFRSSRGRTITHAFGFRLPAGPRPKIKRLRPGDEEAQALSWIPLAALRRDECFEDHFTIVHRLAARAVD